MNRVKNFTGNHATEKQSPTENPSLKENRPSIVNQTTNMDVPRTGVKAHKIRRRIMIGGAAVVGLAAITIGLARLKPALPTVARNSVWIEAVKRGPLLRQVRGLGTLVPEDISWIAARNDARVDKIVIWPGTEVNADTVILTLTNPELQQAALDADAAVTSAQARLVNLRAQLQGQSLERRAALTLAEGERDAANAERDVNERLAKEGLIAALDLKKSQITAREKTAAFEIEKQRYDFTQQAIEPQLAVAQSDLDQAKAQAALKHSQVDALQVRAGMKGVLQQIAVAVGQQVTAGTNLARVADPMKLKAQIKIAETQARDIKIGESASIDTRTSGIVLGKVSRVDPAVQQGTVLVDVSFGENVLPKTVRSDLGVEGTIELERLTDVIYVGRPAFGQDESTIGLFKLTPDGNEAVRTKVALGRGSVNAIEIRSGLQPGDQVILSDTSAYDNQERIRLR
jgi:HlyD family secretion protein